VPNTTITPSNITKKDRIHLDLCRYNLILYIDSTPTWSSPSGIGHETAFTSTHQPRPSIPAMSQTYASASSSSYFQSVFNAALEAYEKKTESKLLDHPLAAQLQSCDSPTAILSVLQDLIQQFDRRRRSDQRLANWLNPTVNVLYAFSSVLGEGVGLVSPILPLSRICDLIIISQVFSPANVVFSGIGMLLLVSIISISQCRLS
jgi:hypothetical protein